MVVAQLGNEIILVSAAVIGTVHGAGSGDGGASDGAKESHSEVKAVPHKNHACGIGRSRQAVLRKSKAGASPPLLLDSVARREVAVGRKRGNSEEQSKCQQTLEVSAHAGRFSLG